MTNRPSFTRVQTMLPDIVKVEHMDGTMTTFGSEAAYGIFIRGLRETAFNLYDARTEQWIVGTLDQLDDAAKLQPTKAIYGNEAREIARRYADQKGYRGVLFDAAVDGFLDGVAGNDRGVRSGPKANRVYVAGYAKGEAAGLTIKTVGAL